MAWFTGGYAKTDNGVVSWNLNPENFDMVLYLNFYNKDSYDKEVQIEVTLVWEAHNCQEYT